MTPQEPELPTGGSSSVSTEYSRTHHIDDRVLVRALDDELSGAETLAVDSHLAVCEPCRLRFHEFRYVSGRLEASVTALRPVSFRSERDRLVQALAQTPLPPASPVRGQSAGPRTARRFGWSMALAAGLALALVYVPRSTVSRHPAANAHSLLSSTLEVDGETFVALPYSNPDLPVNSSHIVQMQVPISSLADAGLVLEPVSRQIAAPNRSVLADVLLGIDGQPLGVHVLSE